MFSYGTARIILARVVGFLLTLLAAATFLFVAIRVIPGSPAQSALGLYATPQAVARFNAEHGLDRALVSQYADWLGDLARGDLGESYQSGAAVAPEIAARIPVTLELALLSFLIANFIAIPLGILAAAAHRRAPDRLARIISTLVSALPSVVLATLLVLVLSVHLRWLPAGGFTPITDGLFLNLKHLVLPSLALGISSSGLLIRMMRASLIEVLSAPYILTARAKGLSLGQVVRWHAMRMAMLSYLPVAAVELGFLIGGVVIIEELFRLPGVGAMVLTGILNRDTPVLLASALTVTFCVLVTTLFVDVVTVLFDPRPKSYSA